MKERRQAPPGKKQESTRPAATGFDFGSNADARQMLGTGSDSLRTVLSVCPPTTSVIAPFGLIRAQR